jgi:hypothetical protein
MAYVRVSSEEKHRDDIVAYLKLQVRSITLVHVDEQCEDND